MAKILIKKRVSFEFLGEDYKDDYIVFKSIPIKDYSELLKSLPEEGSNDTAKSIEVTLKCLQDNFLEGKFGGENLTKEDLVDLDQPTAIKCFEVLVGSNPDPKSEESLPTPSSTDSQPH